MTTFRSLNRGALAAGSALAATLLLAACGGGEASGGDGHGAAHGGGKGAGKSGNAADVSFAKGMIPHHRQAWRWRGSPRRARRRAR